MLCGRNTIGQCKNMEAKEALSLLESKVGGPVECSRLLLVDYTGSYAAWKAGRKPIPRYIHASIAAHLGVLERETRFELATSTLARWRSTS